jgi:hypothetical protein
MTDIPMVTQSNPGTENYGIANAHTMLLLRTWMVRMPRAQKRAIDCDGFYSYKKEIQAIDEGHLKIGSRVQTIDEECSKTEVSSDS